MSLTEHNYPTLLRQQFTLIVKGPISLHKTKVHTDVNRAIRSDLTEEKLCIDEICQISNITMQCEENMMVDVAENGTCLDEVERMEVLIGFNITLSNR